MGDNEKRVMDTGTAEPETAARQAPAQAADEVDLADSAALLAAVTAERDQLASERADLYDRLLRRTAEFDNYRRRVERERAEFAEFAGMETVGALLPVLDDFERALKVEPADKEYAKGMELIYQSFLDILKKIGLEPIEATGRPFDPYLHHAVEKAPTGEVEDNTVLEELRRGYNFKGRLLRPAMVKVAVKP
jgi:molecular chaperone GrpE